MSPLVAFDHCRYKISLAFRPQALKDSRLFVLASHSLPLPLLTELSRHALYLAPFYFRRSCRLAAGTSCNDSTDSPLCLMRGVSRFGMCGRLHRTAKALSHITMTILSPSLRLVSPTIESRLCIPFSERFQVPSAVLMLKSTIPSCISKW